MTIVVHNGDDLDIPRTPHDGRDLAGAMLDVDVYSGLPKTFGFVVPDHHVAVLANDHAMVGLFDDRALPVVFDAFVAGLAKGVELLRTRSRDRVLRRKWGGHCGRLRVRRNRPLAERGRLLRRLRRNRVNSQRRRALLGAGMVRPNGTAR
jgi:hypothetical protein